MLRGGGAPKEDRGGNVQGEVLGGVQPPRVPGAQRLAKVCFASCLAEQHAVSRVALVVLLLDMGPGFVGHSGTCICRMTRAFDRRDFFLC